MINKFKYQKQNELPELEWATTSKTEEERREALLYHFYNKYAQTYNQHSILAQAGFSEISSMLGQRHKSKERVLEKSKLQLKNDIKKLSKKAEESQNVKPLTIQYLKTVALKSVNGIVMPNPICFPSVKTVISELLKYTSLIHSLAHKEKEENLKTLINEKLNKLHERFIGIIDVRIHMSALGIVIKRVFDLKYPEHIELIDEMGEQERKKIKQGVSGSFDLQKNAYWETAYELYDDLSTWEEVYQKIEQMRNKAGIAYRYTSFKSFKRAKSRFDKKRSSGKK